jgi:hypothetical protein
LIVLLKKQHLEGAAQAKSSFVAFHHAYKALQEAGRIKA